MNEWIIPGNSTVYDHGTAFNKYELITWGFKSEVEIGDVIYIRVAGGSNTMHKCIVEKINIKEYELIGSEFWSTPFKYDVRKNYANISLLQSEQSPKLGFSELKRRGLNGTHQVACHLIEPLRSYVHMFFDSKENTTQ